MNNSSSVYQEFVVVRQQRQSLEAAIRHNRLLKEAVLISRSANGGWAARRITHFAEWMIVTGESLRQRYSPAAMRNYHSRTGALAP